MAYNTYVKVGCSLQIPFPASVEMSSNWGEMEAMGK